MKTSNKLFYCLSFALLMGTSGEAQFFKKLAKKAEKAAERTVERRVDRETTKKTDQALDSILEPGSGGKQSPGNPQGNGNLGGTVDENGTSTGPVTAGPKTIEVYSKFDYVPGDKPIFYDDFNSDFMGDFPSKWNTNGSGEVVTLGTLPGKWYSIANK